MSHFVYKEYFGSAEVDIDSKTLHGRILFIRDVIGYSALDASGLEKAFHEAVDEYLADCAAAGESPDVPCKGSFNVRVGAERHRAIALKARLTNVGLNDFVCMAIDMALGTVPATPYTVVHRHEMKLGFTNAPQEMTAFAGSPYAKEVALERNH